MRDQAGVKRSPSSRHRKAGAEQRRQAIGLRQEALVAAGLERGEAGFEQMHVRVLQPYAIVGQARDEALAGAHVALHEIERRVHMRQHFGLARQPIAPRQRKQHEREIVEIGRWIEHRAVARQRLGPAPVRPSRARDQVLAPHRRKRSALLPAQAARRGRKHISAGTMCARAYRAAALPPRRGLAPPGSRRARGRSRTAPRTAAAP